MKKRMFLALVAGLLFTTAVKGQAVHRFNSITDTYYGFPNLYTFAFRIAQAGKVDALDLKGGSVGPTGVRTEFLLTDHFGIGVDSWFAQSNLNFNLYSSKDSVTYHHHYSTTKFASILTFNAHYGKGDKFEGYSSFGIGYSHRTFKFDSDDPNFTHADVRSPIPIAMRFSTGMRYYINRFVGINAAFGIGGPLISVGMTAKF